MERSYAISAENRIVLCSPVCHFLRRILYLFLQTYSLLDILYILHQIRRVPWHHFVGYSLVGKRSVKTFGFILPNDKSLRLKSTYYVVRGYVLYMFPAHKPNECQWYKILRLKPKNCIQSSLLLLKDWKNKGKQRMPATHSVGAFLTFLVSCEYMSINFALYIVR